MKLAPMFAQLFELEQQIAAAAEADDQRNAIRFYEWRPSGYPELPAIWNWIDDGTYEIDDTARATDSLIVTVTIAVRPADLGETIGRLVTLTDIALEVLDPALWTRPILGNTAHRAKRLRLAQRFDEFDTPNGLAPVMCMDLPVEVHLTKVI